MDSTAVFTAVSQTHRLFGEPRYVASRVAHDGINLCTFSFVINAIWEGHKEICCVWDAFMWIHPLSENKALGQ